MQRFEFFNPVKIIFGAGTLNELKKHTQKYKNILLVIGKSSLKKTGVFDRIIELLKQKNVYVLEGIKPNPELDKVKKGIELVKENNIDLILAAGGGSVIDTAKAISAGSFYNGDIWDFYMGKFKPSKVIDIGVILTIAATGSEMNCISVITNKQKTKKIGSSHFLLYPKFSILDPELLLTLDYKNTAFSAIDIIAHALEGYFTTEDKNIPIQRGFVKVIIDTVIKSMMILKDNLKDIDARSNMMWASTIALNGLLTAGIGKYRFENHMIGHALGAFYDMPHGATLSIVLPAWMKYNIDLIHEQLKELGAYIGLSDITPDKTIEYLEMFFKQIHAPVRLIDLNIKHIDNMLIDSIIDTAALRRIEFSREYIKQILKRAQNYD